MLQLSGTVAGLVFAGHETTKNQLGWMLRTLVGHRHDWDRVGRDPSQAPTVVEECLGIDPPSPGSCDR